MLIVQHDVGVALPSDKHFRRVKGQDVFLSIGSPNQYS